MAWVLFQTEVRAGLITLLFPRVFSCKRGQAALAEEPWEGVDRLGENLLTIVCPPVVSSHCVFSNTQRILPRYFIC